MGKVGLRSVEETLSEAGSCLSRSTEVALRGLEAVRQSRLHLRVVSLWSFVAHSDIQWRGLMARTQT